MTSADFSIIMPARGFGDLSRFFFPQAGSFAKIVHWTIP